MLKIVSCENDHMRIQLLEMEILPASILFTTQKWLTEKNIVAFQASTYKNIAIYSISIRLREKLASLYTV